jgi:GST-like protein
MSDSPGHDQSSSLTLISAPVSGYAMRIRYLAAKKGLAASAMEIKLPADFGGLKGPEYLALNPLGKMPALIIHDPPGAQPSALFESKVIADYIIDRFASDGPSFVPKTAERRAVGHLVASICDTYVGQLQPYMYKPYAGEVDRLARVQEMGSAFDAIESVLDSRGPYVCGEEISIGDVALFGKFVF